MIAIRVLSSLGIRGRASRAVTLAITLLAALLWWAGETGRLGPARAEASDITYIYDALGRLSAVVDPASDTAVYSYDSVGNLLSISRQSSALVSIIGFSPGSGAVGSTVTISGTGFSPTAGQNTVTFNGTAATVSAATATQLVVTVPAGATTGTIAVAAPAGSASSNTPFTVTGVTGSPTITGFTPTIAVSGTAVSITGTNFDPTPSNDKVKFNSVGYAVVTSATPTAMSTSVPTATGSGRISVATPSGTGVSSGDFFIPPAPYTAAAVAVTGRMSTGGGANPITISTPNKIALIVFDGAAGQRLTLQITGVTIASSTVAVYAPTASQLTSATVTTSGTSLNLLLTVGGTYTILVAPASSNTGSMTLTFSTPDLVPTALTAPGSAATQQAISIAWTVANQGTGASNGTRYDSAYLSPNAVCCTGATFIADLGYTASIAAGGSDSRTQTVTVPNVPAGNYYLIVVVDRGLNLIYEANENNNQRAVPITIGTPDLTPTALTAPGSAATQQAISIAWTVANQGTGASSPVGRYDSVYLSPNAVCCTGATFVADLGNTAVIAAGGSDSRTQTVTVPNVPAGNYYLIVVVDRWLNLVYEADETNNQRAVPITIGTPDLTPTALTAPGSAATQQAISIAWTVANQGTGASSPVGRYDSVYLSPNAVCCTGATFVADLGNTAVIAAGGSDSRTQTVTVPKVPAGNYYLIVVVDRWLNLVYEADETNNQRAVPITIGTPDLTPTALTAPGSAATQQAISIAWTVANQGTGASSPVGRYDSVYLSPNAVCCTGATFVADLGNTAVIAAGGSDSRTQTVTVPKVPAGNYYLIVVVDRWLNLVYEADETNNQRAVPITIGTPDLTPTALTAPGSAATQQAISIAWTVANQGTGASSPVGRYDSVYLSPNAVCCTGATFVADLGNTAVIAAGGSDSRTQTVTVPNVPAGNYYLIVVVDRWLNLVYEADETNNQRAVPITIGP